MSNRILSFRPLLLACLTFVMGGSACGQSFMAELKAEHDPGKRMQMALEYADQSFQTAHDYYNKGIIKKGDEHLEYMTSALRECVDALQQSHKARFYKKAEMNVAELQNVAGRPGE